MVATVLLPLTLMLATTAMTRVQDEQVPVIRAESERYVVEALDPGGGDRPARVIVSDRVTSRRHMVMVNSTMGEVRRAVIRDDQQRVTLVCGKGFAVIDPAGVANTDEVYGLDVVLSPGGRWIAHRRFFPPTHPGPTEGIAVYDTRLSRENNHSAYPIASEREWRAGQAIYPPAEDWKEANAVVAPADAHLLSSALAWEGGRADPVLLFSMRRGVEDTVVLAAFGNDGVRTCWSKLPGPADRWRVKTLRYAGSGRAGTVTVSSSAVSDARETTIAFPDTCSGEVR
jgi:hypothetical protein